MRFLLLPAALLLNGCFFTTSDVGIRTIESTPPGALVTIEGYGECETPCTVKLDAVRNVTVAKAGYLAQRFGVKPKGPPVTVILELAAPAGDVDATPLPEID